MAPTPASITTLRDTLSAASLLSTFHDANMPLDDQGRVYHVGCKRGDVANRVVSVGDPRRAALLATFLDDDDDGGGAERALTADGATLPLSVRVIPSKRGFTTYTGRFHGVPVSIVATGMGTAMMDFLVRETRAVVDGPMLIVRLGTAGTPQRDISVGSMAVATGSVAVTRLCEAFDDAAKSGNDAYYHFSKPCMADAALTAHLRETLTQVMPDVRVIEGLNATADSFYSSQGRRGKHFVDHNETLVHDLTQRYPDLVSLEMETYQLLHLARASRAAYAVRAAATTILLANRITNAFAEPAVLTQRECDGGRAVLEAITTAALVAAEDDDAAAVAAATTASAAPAAP